MKKMDRESTVAIGGLLALLASHLCPAAEALPVSMQACATLQRDSERLACFDRAVAVIQSGAESAAPLSAENMFGASSEVTGASGNPQPVKREELKQISGTVTSLRHVDDGMIVLELDNGQVWRQQDSGVSLFVSTGDTVTVARAAMGTFRIADKTGRYARFKRIR